MKIAGTSDWEDKLINAQFAVNNTLNRSVGSSLARMLFEVDQLGLPEELRTLLISINDQAKPDVLKQKFR